MPRMALRPRSGVEPWQATPVVEISIQRTPLCAVTTPSSVGSSTRVRSLAKPLLRQRARAVVAGFLAHESEENPVDARIFARGTLRPVAQGPEGGGHRAFRIAGAAAPDFVVAQDGVEGRDGHAGDADGVEVRGEGEAGSAVAGGRERGDDIGAARFDRLDADLGAEAAQEGGDVVGHGLLAGGADARIALRIHARDRDKVLQELNDIPRAGHAAQPRAGL